MAYIPVNNFSVMSGQSQGFLGLTRIVRESDYSPTSQLFRRVKKTMTGNYHKLDLVNIDAHTKFGLIMSIRSQDIERKRNSDLNKGP